MLFFLTHGHLFSAAAKRNRAAGKTKNGGARRDRTDDLKLAKLPLSQLSYGPKTVVNSTTVPLCRPVPSASATYDRGSLSPIEWRSNGIRQVLVGLGRVELPTSRLSGVRSNHLSYRPVFEVAASKHHQRKRSSMRRKRNEGGGVPH